MLYYPSFVSYSPAIESSSDEMQMPLTTRLAALEAAVPIMELTPQGIITYVNERFLHITGYTREELLGKPHRILVPERLAHDTLYQEFLAQLGSGTVFEGEHERIRKDGSTLWLHGVYSPVIDEHGLVRKVVKVVSLVVNTREQSVLAQERHLRDMIIKALPYHAFDLITFANAQGIITFASHAVEHILGWRVEDIVGKPFVEFIHPDDLPQTLTLFSKVLEHHKALAQIRLRTASHEYRWMEIATTNELENPLFHALVSHSRDVTQQREAEERLRLSEIRLMKSQEVGRVGSWELDLRTNAVWWSPQAYNVLGIDPNTFTLTLEHYHRLVHPEDLPKLQAAAEQTLATGKEYEIVLRHIQPNGEVRYNQARGGVRYDEHGKPAKLYGTVLDIHMFKMQEFQLEDMIAEREQAEREMREMNAQLGERVAERTRQLHDAIRQLEVELDRRAAVELELRESQSQLQAVFNSSLIGLAVTDAHGVVLRSNKQFATILGFDTASALVGKVAPQLIAPERREAATELFRAIQQQQESVFTIEERVPTIDGRLIDVFVGIARHVRESDQQTFYVAALTDITRRKTAERGLAQALQELQSLYRALPDVYFLVDAEQRFLRCYTATPEQLFMPPEQFIGKSFADILPASFAKTFSQLFSQAQRSRQLLTHEYMLPIRGIEQHFEARFSPMENRQMLIVVRNVTERKRAEEEIRSALQREQELNTLKTRFIAMVSHEFRTPLTTIRSTAELLKRSRHKMTEEKQAQYFDDIDHAIKAMTQLLEDVLYLGKAGANSIQCTPFPTDVRALCARSIEAVQRMLQELFVQRRASAQTPERVTSKAANNEANDATAMLPDIVLDIPSELPMALLDERLVRQMLENLLSNALKYSPADKPVMLNVTTTSNTITFRVADNGIGMSEEDIKLLFEPFHRGRNVGTIPGTGLGMAIVQQAVQLHRGTIDCQSSEHQGTTFTVTIPCEFVR
jgi:PAS domain S-box-containing protein